MRVNNYLKVILLIPFLFVSIIFYFQTSFKELEAYSATFISISLTIATFSITFSFLQYQFSPYKSLLRSVSIKQLGFSYLTILIALTPLFTLFFNKNFVPIVSLFSIPILAYFTILLWIISKEESDPEILINRKFSSRRLNKFLIKFEKKNIATVREQEQFNFSKADETPMHSFIRAEYSPQILSDDPFYYANNVIAIALSNADLEVYEIVLDKFLKVIDIFLADERLKKRPLLFSVQKLIKNSFESLTHSTLNLTKSDIIHNRFLLKISIYLKGKALTHLQIQEPFVGMTSSLTEFAKEVSQKRNFEGVILVLSLFRELAQKGIYDSPQENSRMFENHLGVFPQQIKLIGQEAVKLNDSNILYRCLEELGYLGCSAIKNNQYHVGIECLDSLVQLGREVRASKMKCFWTRCSLEPIDHADERIWWMLSWVWRLEKGKQARWINSFETAYSRLRGYKRGIELIVENDEPTFKFNDSKEPHIESFLQERYSGEMNYSNFDNIKELKLY